MKSRGPQAMASENGWYAQKILEYLRTWKHILHYDKISALNKHDESSLNVFSLNVQFFAVLLIAKRR